MRSPITDRKGFSNTTIVKSGSAYVKTLTYDLPGWRGMAFEDG